MVEQASGIHWCWYEKLLWKVPNDKSLIYDGLLYFDALGRTWRCWDLSGLLRSRWAGEVKNNSPAEMRQTKALGRWVSNTSSSFPSATSPSESLLKNEVRLLAPRLVTWKSPSYWIVLFLPWRRSSCRWWNFPFLLDPWFLKHIDFKSQLVTTKQVKYNSIHSDSPSYKCTLLPEEKSRF